MTVSGGDRFGTLLVGNTLDAPDAGEIYVNGGISANDVYAVGGSVNTANFAPHNAGSGGYLEVEGFLLVSDDLQFEGGDATQGDGGNGGQVYVEGHASIEDDFDMDGGDADNGNGGNGGYANFYADLGLDEVRVEGGHGINGSGGNGASLFVKGNLTVNEFYAGHGGGCNSANEGHYAGSGGSVTVEAWINPADFIGTWMPIVTKDNAGAQRSYSLWLNSNGSVYGDSRDASGFHGATTAAGAVVLNTWTHVALVIDRNAGAAGVRLFINGVDATASTSGGAPNAAQPAVNSGGPLRIGATGEPNGAYATFDGAIDEVRVWSVARTGAQIAAAMNTPLNGSQTGLVVCLPLDGVTALTTPNLVAGGDAGTLVNTRSGLGGTTIAGVLAVPGQTDSYRFTLTERTLIAMDSLPAGWYATSLSWRLTSSGGFDLTRNLASTDSYDGFPVLELAAGTYTLTIDGAGPVTSPYGLRLIDLATLPTLTPGTPVNGTLRPGSRPVLAVMRL
jgi:hypothetical protein